MNKPLYPITFDSDAITSTLHFTLKLALEMALENEQYTACARIKSAMEDLEIKHLLNGKDI